MYSVFSFPAFQTWLPFGFLRLASFLARLFGGVCVCFAYVLGLSAVVIIASILPFDIPHLDPEEDSYEFISSDRFSRSFTDMIYDFKHP